MVKQMSADYHELLQNLEEGIILVSNNTVNFSNNIFLDILKATKMVDDKSSTIPTNAMDLKIFKLFRGNDSTDISLSQENALNNNNGSSSSDDGQGINTRNMKKLIRKNLKKRQRGSISSGEEIQSK